MRGTKPLFWVDTKFNTEQHSPYLSSIMDVRSVGLKELLGKELQVVVDLGSLDIEFIMGDIGARALEGEKMHKGIKLTGYIPNYPNYPILLKEIKEDKTLRIIFPDRMGKLPDEDGCEYPFNLQNISISMLHERNGELN